MKEKLIVLLGPTASGKTHMGVRLAKRLNGEIISADSMQIYKYMNIGTAKPTLEEMDGVPHYMVDNVYPDEEFTVATFRQLSEEYIEEILSRKKMPIVVGGTGLYINSLTKPWNFSQTEPNKALRLELTQLAEEKGKQYLHDRLKEVDPISAEAIHPNNQKRVVRALEVYESSGRPKSELDKESMENELRFNPIILGLTWDRRTLYKRIELRVDHMIELGLIDEVKKLLDMGYSKNLVSMQGLGYKEIVKYLQGEYDLEEAIEVLKRDTRHFAKRQLTWFRKNQEIKWFEMEEYQSLDELEEAMINYLKGKI